MRTAVPSITAARIPIIVNVAELMVMLRENNILVVKYLGWILTLRPTVPRPQWTVLEFSGKI